MATNSNLSFTDSTTIQLRLELGQVTHGVVTTDIPDDVNFNEADGYGFAQSDSQYVGRLRGAEGQFYVPLDTYTPSPIEDLFAWTDINAVRTAPVDDLGQWIVTVNGQEVAVTAVSRKANILDTGTTGWQRDFATVQNVFLEMAAPLQEGDRIAVRFDDPDFETVSGRYEPDRTLSEAIHVNLAGFDPDDGIKTAYLSSWNGFEHDPAHERGGEGVPQNYSEGLGFQVINQATGAVAHTGTTVLAQAQDAGTNFWQNYASTAVFQMDFSELEQSGTYYVVVDGVGRSQSFEIDDQHWADVFGLAFNGYYHQRSGIALTEEFTEFERPRAMHPDDGITVHKTTVKITETSEAWDGSLPKPFDFWEGNLTGETLSDAWGGWHDAGDFDRRTQHMETSRKLIELHELHTSWSEDFDGNIPETGDGIPDILDEAIWGTEVFRRLQQDDGGIPGGIESASYGGFGDSSFTDQRDLYVYAADAWSSWEYAATAAKIARALAPYDAREAAAWQDSAVSAFDWAEANTPPPQEYDNGYYPAARNIAAVELFETTGQEAYHDIFAQTFVYSSGQSVEWFEQQFEAAFAYAMSSQGGVDAAIRADAVNALSERAEWLLANGTNSGFGFVADPYAPYGWGNTASQPTNSSEIMLRMHALTGDEKYLLTAHQDVDYALGANPMNMSFVTGLDTLVPDVRQAEHILDADSDVLGGTPKPGITLFGEYNIKDYGWSFYHSDMWLDTWPNYYDAPVHESWNANYSYVPVTEFTVMQGMEDMTFVTGYLAAMADTDTPADPDPSLDGPLMEVGSVRIAQTSATYWQRVDFETPIDDAIVVMGPGSSEGPHPFAVRVRDVDETGFEFQIDEWDYLDGPHVNLSISWMAGSEGRHTLDDGTEIAFGSANQPGTIALEDFDDTPLVFGQLVGEADGTSLTHRLRNIDADSFEFRTQTEEALRGQDVEKPGFNYVAILDDVDGGLLDAGTIRANHMWTELPEEFTNSGAFFADMQTLAGWDTATVRYDLNGAVGPSIRVVEERSADFETAHAFESIAYLGLEDGVYEL